MQVIMDYHVLKCCGQVSYVLVHSIRKLHISTKHSLFLLVKRTGFTKNILNSRISWMFFLDSEIVVNALILALITKRRD